MKLGRTLEVRDRREWRAWLSRNGGRKTEIWLVYYRKSSGKPRFPYNDAVEEALCFGWIDGILKNIDEKRYAQRFSPRRPGSALSQANLERVRMLIRRKRMTSAGLKALTGLFDPSSDREEEFSIAPDILRPLKQNRKAWENFQNMSPSYRRIRIAYIESRRSHGKEMFRRSLAHFIKMTGQNKRFGMMK